MIIAAAVFVLLGILIKHGKMYFLIAGYNTMPKDKKKQYDVRGIATLMRNVMFTMAAILALGYVLDKWLEIPNAETIFLSIAILVGLPYLVIKANSKKYKISN